MFAHANHAFRNLVFENLWHFAYLQLHNVRGIVIYDIWILYVSCLSLNLDRELHPDEFIISLHLQLRNL